jgi:16S rRNA (cytosine1402-N4)-methyltransferase
MTPGPDDLSHLHRPVLVAEVLLHLAPRGPIGGLVVDGTVGYGGHAVAMLDAWPQARLLGCDRDRDALVATKGRLARFGARARLFHASYADLVEVLEEAGEGAPDAVLLDVGASSPQLDSDVRGFSFRHEAAPLDMRFDREGGGATAADLVNGLPETELANVLFEHGGERRARPVARAIVLARPLATVGDLRRVVVRVVRRDASGIDPATRTFQALRIAVNDEAGHLARGVRTALSKAAPGGRVAVIAFHSGEERAVKEAFHEAVATGRARIVTKKPVRPTEREVQENPRARPARLRVAEVAVAVGDGDAGSKRGREPRGAR